MLTAKSRELFDFAHSIADPDFYSPAEDSFLFLDTIESNIESIASDHPSPLILEVGPGSGVLSAFTLRALSDRGAPSLTIAVDVNPIALQATLKTFACVKRPTSVECILADATTPMFRKGVFDITLCNPPYVPADRNETHHPLTAAYAGGLPDGREVTDKVIERASLFLTPLGDLWLLLDERNIPKNVVNFAENLGFSGEQISRKKVPGEILYVFKFRKL